MITRRDYYIRCYYWSVDEEDENLTHDETPSGVFFAKAYQNINHNDNEDGGIVNIDSQIVVIETKDDISNLKHRDIVSWLGEKWIVENIQSQIFAKRSQFNRCPDRIWWVSLRNGKDSSTSI